jgi:hypothetical protein
MPTIADLTSDVLTLTNQSRLIFLQSVLEQFVNDAIRRMERRHHFRGQEVTLDPLPYPSGADFVPVPADFVTDRAVWQHNTANTTDPSRALAAIGKKILRPMWVEMLEPPNQRDSLFPAVAASNPPASSLGPLLAHSFYYIWNRGLYIVPTPSQTITLTLDYVRVLPDLTGAQSNWFTDHVQDVVRAGAVAEAYRFLQLADAANIWEQTFQQRLDDAIRQDSTLQLSGTKAARGGESHL